MGRRRRWTLSANTWRERHATRLWISKSRALALSRDAESVRPTLVLAPQGAVHRGDNTHSAHGLPEQVLVGTQLTGGQCLPGADSGGWRRLSALIVMTVASSPRAPATMKVPGGLVSSSNPAPSR